MIYLQKVGIPLKAIPDSPAARGSDAAKLGFQCAGSDRLRQGEGHSLGTPRSAAGKDLPTDKPPMGSCEAGLSQRRPRIGSILPN
jgi:hypothetical protein